MKIKDNIIELSTRDKPLKYIKYKDINDVGKHLTNIQKEADYEYYICDFCEKEIKIENKWENKTGGICTIPATITNGKKITLALHSKCINDVIREFKQN